MYQWVVYLHVIGVFAFLVSHAASMHMAFTLRRERNLERLRALLQLSSDSYRTMFPSRLVIVLTGVLAGIQAHWWRFGWIWVSIVLLLLIVGAMYPMASAVYGAAKSAVGLPHMEKGKVVPGDPPKSPEEIEAILKKANPILLAVIGYGGLAVLAWLMMFKPF